MTSSRLYSLLALVTSIAGQFAIAKSIAPPWPDVTSVAWATAVVMVTTWFATLYIYRRRNRTQLQREKGLRASLILMAGCGGLYLVAIAFLSYIDRDGERHTAGFVYTDEMRIALSDQKKPKADPSDVSPDLTDRINGHMEWAPILKDINFDEFRAWTGGSINIVRCFLLCLWTGAAASFASALAIIESAGFLGSLQTQSSPTVTSSQTATSQK